MNAQGSMNRSIGGRNFSTSHRQHRQGHISTRASQWRYHCAESVATQIGSVQQTSCSITRSVAYTREMPRVMASGGLWANRASLTTLVTKPKPVSKVTNPYSTGKPLKLDLPKLTYAGPVHTSAEAVSSSNDFFAWSRHSQLEPPPLSRADTEFAETEGVQFVWGHEELDVDELNDLFELVGFPRRAPQRLALALQHTHRVIWIRCIRSSRTNGREGSVGKLIGFARATSDGFSTATIWDVAVNPSWQKCGLGTGLIERLVIGLVADTVPCITLYAEPHVVDMYERLGFVKDEETDLLDETVKELEQPILVTVK